MVMLMDVKRKTKVDQKRTKKKRKKLMKWMN